MRNSNTPSGKPMLRAAESTANKLVNACSCTLIHIACRSLMHADCWTCVQSCWQSSKRKWVPHQTLSWPFLTWTLFWVAHFQQPSTHLLMLCPWPHLCRCPSQTPSNQMHRVQAEKLCSQQLCLVHFTVWTWQHCRRPCSKTQIWLSTHNCTIFEHNASQMYLTR